jgi:hypothetical protein
LHALVVNLQPERSKISSIWQNLRGSATPSALTA